MNLLNSALNNQAFKQVMDIALGILGIIRRMLEFVVDHTQIENDIARRDNYQSISPENRDRVKVTQQAGPKWVSDEQEYKLFKKYGKGRWAKRAPAKLATDEWELLI